MPAVHAVVAEQVEGPRHHLAAARVLGDHQHHAVAQRPRARPLGTGAPPSPEAGTGALQVPPRHAQLVEEVTRQVGAPRLALRGRRVELVERVPVGLRDLGAAQLLDDQAGLGHSAALAPDGPPARLLESGEEGLEVRVAVVMPVVLQAKAREEAQLAEGGRLLLGRKRHVHR